MARGQGEGTISLHKSGLYCGRLTVGYDSSGKQKRKAYYGKTKKEVQEKMNLAKVDLANNSYIEPSRKSLAEWIDQWLVDYKKRAIRPSSYYCLYYRPANHHIKPALGTVKLKDLTREMVQEFVNGLSDKGLAHGYLRKQVDCLRSALKQAVNNDLIRINAADSVVYPNETKKEMRVLTVDEQKRFIVAAEQHQFGAIFIFMLATGVRLGEARVLTWGDIDFDKGIVSINKTFSVYYNEEEKKGCRQVNPTKTLSSNRTIPLTPSIMERLHRLKAESTLNQNDDLIFTDQGILPHEDTVRRRQKKILETAGIEADGIHMHTLRHTFATRGLENGVDLIVMKELLGHSSIRMTADIYTHVMPDKKIDSIMKLADTIIL